MMVATQRLGVGVGATMGQTTTGYDRPELDAGIGDERQNNPGRTGGWEHAWFSCRYVVRCGGLHGKICVVQERTSQLTRGLGWRDGVGI